MSDQEVMEVMGAPQPSDVQNVQPVSQFGIFIGLEFAQGGALMFAQAGSIKKSAVIAGDPQSATFQRKVQRTAVAWTKEFYVAPQRAPNKEKEEAETAEAE